VIAARAQAGERGLAYGVVAQLLREAIGSEADALPQPLRGEAARLLPQLGAAPSGASTTPVAVCGFSSPSARSSLVGPPSWSGGVRRRPALV